MKILYSWGHHGWQKHRAELVIEGRRRVGFDITAIDHRTVLGEDKTYTPQELEQRWKDRYKPLLDLYDRVRELVAEHDVFVVEYDNVYLPWFLETLDIFKVYICGDDPEGSDVRSKPYVRYFDYCFAQTLGYDADTLVWEKYLEWDAPRADFSPIGICELDYQPERTEEQVLDMERPLPVVFVGSAGLRQDRIRYLERRTPLTLYGKGWGWFAHLPRFQPLRMLGRLTKWPPDPYLPDEQLVSTYQKAKIGINIHLSYGVGNRRCYALPANGVLQVCDQPALVARLFEPGREIVCYESMHEAVEKIMHYLSHEDERRAVAAAGYRRAVSEYRDEAVFRRAMSKVEEAMHKNRTAKD